MKYGKAQKIVNMTFKYLYCFANDSERKKYFKFCHMPIDSTILEWMNVIFDSITLDEWSDGYKEYYDYSKEYREKHNAFRDSVLNTVIRYKLPVINLDKNTPREAVCKVFENVNTSGVALTVFELVTATLFHKVTKILLMKSRVRIMIL